MLIGALVVGKASIQAAGVFKRNHTTTKKIKYFK
jgi:hypothetical protein